MKTTFAAGVLIQREDGKILATKRVDGQGYGFPCGKLDEGEHALLAAIRECYEETGHVAATYRSFYEAEDDTGHLIRIYYAHSVAKGEPTHPEEGDVVWVTPKTLVEESTWSEYNKAVFEHFKVEWEE